MPHNSIEIFCRSRRIALMILFGSRGRAQSTPASDYDIAIKFQKEATPDVLDIILDLEQIFNGRIDLTIVTMCTDPLLLHEIASGKPLYQSDPQQFLLFQARAWKEYLDGKWQRQRRREWLLQRVREETDVA